MSILQFNLDGLQDSESSARPIPFNVEEELFAGGLFDKQIHKGLVSMFLKDMFPEPKKDPLYRWNDIQPNAIITFVSFTHDMNMSVNKSAIIEGRRAIDIPDREISRKADRVGIYTPRDITERYISHDLSRFRRG